MLISEIFRFRAHMAHLSYKLKTALLVYFQRDNLIAMYFSVRMQLSYTKCVNVGKAVEANSVVPKVHFCNMDQTTQQHVFFIKERVKCK